jgi:O-antigen ligase
VLRRVRPALFATVAVVAVVLGVAFLPATMKERVAAVTGAADGARPADSSLQGRLGENLAAVEMFRDHPVTGVGPDNFELHYAAYAQRVGLDPRPEVRGAHSLYLESLAETGVVGTIAFVALLVAALRAAWVARTRLAGREELLAEGCLVALVSFLVCAATLHLTYPRYLWIFVTLAFAAGRLVPERAS